MSWPSVTCSADSYRGAGCGAAGRLVRGSPGWRRPQRSGCPKGDEHGRGLELGCKLARAHWGRGLAAEAAQACLAWARAERPERVVAIVNPANTRSVRILERIGMVRAGIFSRSGHTWDFYTAG